MLVAGPIDTPFAPASLALDDGTPLTRLDTVGGGGVGGGVVGGTPGVGPNVPFLPGVPEPATWLNLIVGFGVIGGVARYSLRNGAVREDELPETA